MMMTHFFPEAFKHRKNGSSGERSNFGSTGRSFSNGKNDDAARVDQLPLIHHKDVVEVEKVQRADSLQMSYVRARNAHVPCDKRPKVPLA